jgi:hypothetical protein
VEGAAQASGQSATEDLHQTPVKRLVFSSCIYCERGVLILGCRLKVIYFRSKSACKSDPSLLVRRVFFPTTELATILGKILFRVSGFS